MLNGALAKKTSDGFIWGWKPDKDMLSSIIIFKVCTLKRFNEHRHDKINVFRTLRTKKRVCKSVSSEDIVLFNCVSAI